MADDIKRVDDRGELSALEKALIAASALVSLALFAYLAYEGATTPREALPSVEIEAAAEGAWVVLRNDGGRGIAEAIVAVSCGDASFEIPFDDVPAASHRRALVPCEGEVAAKVAWWKPA